MDEGDYTPNRIQRAVQGAVRAALRLRAASLALPIFGARGWTHARHGLGPEGYAAAVVAALAEFDRLPNSEANSVTSIVFRTMPEQRAYTEVLDDALARGLRWSPVGSRGGCAHAPAAALTAAATPSVSQSGGREFRCSSSSRTVSAPPSRDTDSVATSGPVTSVGVATTR